jgi:hypothetical protein
VNINNETCVQRAILRFYYQKSSSLKREENKLLGKYSISSKTDPDKVREFKSNYTAPLYLSNTN